MLSRGTFTGGQCLPTPAALMAATLMEQLDTPFMSSMQTHVFDSLSIVETISLPSLSTLYSYPVKGPFKFSQSCPLNENAMYDSVTFTTSKSIGEHEGTSVYQTMCV